MDFQDTHKVSETEYSAEEISNWLENWLENARNNGNVDTYSDDYLDNWLASTLDPHTELADLTFPDDEPEVEQHGSFLHLLFNFRFNWK